MYICTSLKFKRVEHFKGKINFDQEIVSIRYFRGKAFEPLRVRVHGESPNLKHFLIEN